MIHEEKLLFMLKIENLWKVEKRFLTKREKSALIAAIEKKEIILLVGLKVQWILEGPFWHCTSQVKNEDARIIAQAFIQTGASMIFPAE